MPTQGLAVAPMSTGEAGHFTSELLAQFRFALLNPLRVHDRDWQDLTASTLETVPAPARSRRLPQLIDLADMPAHQCEALLHRNTRYRKRGGTLFSALLATEASPDSVSLHLRRQLLQRRPGDRRRWWLRYYDPDVFRHLRWMLNPVQLARLMGPITRWSWPESSGRWHVIERPGEMPAIDWLALERHQWDGIDRLAALNHSLRRLTTTAPDWPQDVVHWQWLSGIMQHAGDTYGLSLADQQALAECTVERHPDLATHPIIDELLAQAAAGPPDVASRLRRLDDASWHTILSELKERT